MPGLLGKKIGMTSVFSAEGKNVPCTVIEAGPCVVTQVKRWLCCRSAGFPGQEGKAYYEAVDGSLQESRSNTQETLG